MTEIFDDDQAAADGRARRLVAGRGGDQQVGQRLQQAHRRAIDQAIGDHAAQVVGRLAAAPLGEGVALVRAVSGDGGWVAALHTVAGQLPVPFAIDTRTGKAAALPAPSGVRIEIAGFVNGGAK